MSNDSIRPSSLDGIKRLATSLKRERGIPHLQALDEAARKGDFQNFRHARGVLLAAHLESRLQLHPAPCVRTRTKC